MAAQESTQKDILIVEDSASLRRIYREYLKKEELSIDAVGTVKEARDQLNAHRYRTLLLDLKLPDGTGFELLKQVEDTGVGTPVLIMTAHGSIDIAVEAMRLGAYDFLEKPFDARRLRASVVSGFSQFARSAPSLEEGAREERKQYFGFIGASERMHQVYDLIERAAPSKASIFITGESGTGKELCAEALHLQSARREGPFITINCAAIPKDLIESEIFGHLKGSFTGATANRDGAATMADGGTLFLDEIGEMPMDLQSKLLRFIQTGVIQKVGSNKDESVDVRFVCATNRDPLEEVKAGRFREDLYYRLYVIPIELPALRERPGDPLLIAHNFLRKFSKEEGKEFAGFSPEVEQVISTYEWPGNVRQLQNIIRNVVVLSSGDRIEKTDLPPPLNRFEPMESVLPTSNAASVAQATPLAHETGSTGPVSVENASVVSDQATSEIEQRVSHECVANAPVDPLWATCVEEIRPLADVEREIIENAITLCDDNVPRAAGLLGLSPSTIYRKRQSWGIE